MAPLSSFFRRKPTLRDPRTLRANAVVQAARLAGAGIPPDDALGLASGGRIPVIDAQRQALDAEQAAGGGARASIDASLRGSPQAGVEGVPPTVAVTPNPTARFQGSGVAKGRTVVDVVGRARDASFEGSPAYIIEQRILEATAPTLSADGSFDANVFAGFDLVGRYPNKPGVQAAFTELAQRYGVNITGDPLLDRQAVVRAVVSRRLQSDEAVRSAPNEFVTGTGSSAGTGLQRAGQEGPMTGAEARAAGESLSGQPFPDRVGPQSEPQAAYLPLEIRESGMEPKPLLDDDGKPVLDENGQQMIQLVQDGEDSDQLLVRQQPFTRSKIYAARDMGDGADPLVDKSKELTVLAIRRTGGDGNRSAASKMFVLPLEGGPGQRMYQIIDVEGRANELISEPAMLDLVESQGWQHFSGPKLPGLRGSSFSFPPTPEAAGRQLVEYTKSGATQGTVLAVKDLDRLKAQGNGELFQEAISLAGGGVTADEASDVVQALAARKRMQSALSVRSSLSGADLTGDPNPDDVVAALRDRPEFYGLHDSELLQYATMDAASLEEQATKPFNPGAQAKIQRFNDAYARGLEMYRSARTIAIANDPQTAYDDLRSGMGQIDASDPLSARTTTVQPENMDAFFRNDPVEEVDPKTGTRRYTDPRHERLRQIEMGYRYGKDDAGRTIVKDTVPRTATGPSPEAGGDPAENALRIQEERARAEKLRQAIERVAKIRQAAARPVDVAGPVGMSTADSVSASPGGGFTEVTDPSMSIGRLPFAPDAPVGGMDSGPAVWKNRDYDVPVFVDGIEPDVGADGRRYARVRKQLDDPSAGFTYVPLDEISFDGGDRSSFLDSMFGVQPQAAGTMNFGTVDGTWAGDQVRRAKAAGQAVDLGSGPIDVNIPSVSGTSDEARRLSIAIGTRRRMTRGAGDGVLYDQNEVRAALTARPEFAGLSDAQLDQYIASPIEDLMRRADAATSTAEAFSEGSVAGPRVMTQLTRGALPGNINAQRPIATQADAGAGVLRGGQSVQSFGPPGGRTSAVVETFAPQRPGGQEGLDEASAAIRQHKANLKALDAELRKFRKLYSENETLVRAVRQHLKDLQWRQTLADDPDLAAQVAGTPEGDPIPVSQRPEFAQFRFNNSPLGDDPFRVIETLTSEEDAAEVLERLREAGASLEEPIARAVARRQNIAEQLEAAGVRADESRADVNREVMQNERLAGSEDINEFQAQVNRVETGVDQQDRELTADFARENRSALEDVGQTRSAEKMREAYRSALASIYGDNSTITMPLAVRDYEFRMPNERPSQKVMYDFEDMQRAIDRETDPTKKALLQAEYDTKADQFSGADGADDVVRHPTGQNQSRLLKELATTSNKARRLELAAELWGIQFTGMDRGWRAPMDPVLREGEDHGISVLQAVSRATNTPISDLVYEALARNAELRDFMTPTAMRQVGRSLEADIEYASRFSPEAPGAATGPVAAAGAPANPGGIRGLLGRIKQLMGIGPPEPTPARIEEPDPNDPILVSLENIAKQIPSAVGDQELRRLDTRIVNSLAVAERASPKVTRSYQTIFDRAAELRRALKARMDQEGSGYKEFKNRPTAPGLDEPEEPLNLESRPATPPVALGASQVAGEPALLHSSERPGPDELNRVVGDVRQAKQRLQEADQEVAARLKEARRTKTEEARAAARAAIVAQKEAKQEYARLRSASSRVRTTVLLSKEDADQLRGWMTGKLTSDDASVDRATGWPKLTVTTGKPGVYDDGSGAGVITIERGYRTYDDKTYDASAGEMVPGRVGDQPRNVTLKKSVSGRVLKPVKGENGLSRQDIPEGMVAVDFDKDGNPLFFYNSQDVAPYNPPTEVTLGDTTFDGARARRGPAGSGQPAAGAAAAGDSFEENAPANTGQRYTYEGEPFADDADEVGAPARNPNKDSVDAAAARSQEAASSQRLTPDEIDAKKRQVSRDRAREADGRKVRRAKAVKKGVTGAAVAGGLYWLAADQLGSGEAVAGDGSEGDSLLFGTAPEDTNTGGEAAGDQVRRARRRQYSLMTPNNPVYWQGD